MKRYQIYLNAHSVSILDDFQKVSDVSRSKLIREAIDRLAEQIVSLVPVEKKSQYDYFDRLAGIIDTKEKQKTNFAQKVDEIYFTD